MRIGHIAKVLDVSRETIRRLERKGLLTTQRDWAGHRRFNEDDVTKAPRVAFREELRVNRGRFP